MAKNRIQKSDRKAAYKIDRGWRSIKAGAAMGMLFGALVFMLFSRWLPGQFFVPTILIAAAIFAVVFGLIWPMELSYQNFDDDPDNITAAERVDRLHSEAGAGSDTEG